jgi:hypothetical protein
LSEPCGLWRIACTCSGLGIARMAAASLKNKRRNYGAGHVDRGVTPWNGVRDSLGNPVRDDAGQQVRVYS